MATTSPDRIITLDLIRGIAVMGIFSVNVISMGMYNPAYGHPPAFGFEGLGDKLQWFVNFILVDGKMRTLFTLLFGASMLLVIERAVAAARKPGRAHYARMITLLLIALVHYYFIWQGDILFEYAVGGMLAFLWWKRKTKTILIWAVILLVWNAATVNAFAVTQQFAAAEDIAEGNTDNLPPGQYDYVTQTLDPDADRIAQDTQRTANPLTYFRDGLKQGGNPYFSLGFWFGELLGTILVGMALYRIGFLSGANSDRVYRRWALWGLGGGAAVSAVIGALVWKNGFGFEWTFAARNGWTTIFRVPMAIGYAALIVLAFRHVGAFGKRVAAVGRTAFSNYLGVSILMLPFVQGWGLGLYNELSRGEYWIIFVPAMWALMLFWSPWWLERYRYGPLEWAWRSLARFKLQPMRKTA